MKKIFLTLFIAMISAQSFAQNSCLDIYQDLKWNKNSTAKTLRDKAGPIGFVAALPLGLMGMTGTLIASYALVGSGFAISAGAGLTILIHDHKYNKMIKLINQSNDFVETGVAPGKLLVKLHKLVENEISIEDLAKFIVEANENKSLCSNEVITFKKLPTIVDVNQN
jgi:hypothetical protein